jgi:hypothetical protein
MALETLKGVTQIDGEGVAELNGFADGCKPEYIVVNHAHNSISFKIQDGPVKEVGKNGCQVTALIDAALLIIKGLNERFTCRENAITITKLEEALMWQRKRTENREERGVEGLSKA